MSLSVDPVYLNRVLVDLVQIDSRNPSLTPGSPGEAAIGAYLTRAMGELGLEVTLHELGAGRVNVVGRRPGSGSGKSLMWNGHMDTVGVAGMAEPFSGRIQDGRLYGRGSQDMKASLAAMLAGVKVLNEANIHLQGDLLLTAVADEEYASLGTADLVRHYTADAAIVTEPTDLALCRAHRGFIWYDVETVGKAAHGSRFDEGVDAIMHMGRFLAGLDKLERALRQRPAHELAGVPSLHASIIDGGTEISVYPSTCHLQVERRTIPGESMAQATAELQAIIDDLATGDPRIQARVSAYLGRSPFAISAQAPIVQAVEAAATAHLGAAPRHMGATFWTDAAILADAGIDTVLIGPAGQGLHSAEEWVDLQSAADLAAILAHAAIRFCGTEG